MRPNSPPQITSVSSSMPRRFRSLISAAQPWSISLHCDSCSVGKWPCASQPRWKIWILRTPRSASRRAFRQQAANVPGVRASSPYKLKCLLRLLRKIHQLGHRRLHAIGHFVLLDSRQNFRVGEPIVLLLVDRRQGIQLCATIVRGHTRRIAQVQHRIALAAQQHALMIRRQETRCPTGD